MKSCIVGAFALLGISTAASGDTFVPSEADLQIVKAEIAKQMLDPESTRIFDVLATEEMVDADLMTWVCGKYQGRNGFGGYAQPSYFMGAIVESPTSGRVFLPIAVAGQSDAEVLSVLQGCLERVK